MTKKRVAECRGSSVKCPGGQRQSRRQERTKEQLAALTRQVEALREYARLAWLRFDEGYSSYIEVTYSQNLLYNAELIRTAVQRSPLQAFANLYKAMGAQASEFSRRSRTFLASAGVAKLTIKTNTKNAVDLNIESSERVALRLILWNVWYGHRL